MAPIDRLVSRNMYVVRDGALTFLEMHDIIHCCCSYITDDDDDDDDDAVDDNCYWLVGSMDEIRLEVCNAWTIVSVVSMRDSAKNKITQHGC